MKPHDARARAREKSVSDLLAEWRRMEEGAASLIVKVREAIAELDEEIRDFPAKPPKSARPRCGAKRRDGQPCGRPVAFGSGRCLSHGGRESDIRARYLAQLHAERDTLRVYLGVLVPLSRPTPRRR